MYFIPYLFNHAYIFIGCIDFSSWLGLACIVLFLIFTVHSYVAPSLNKLIYLFTYLFIRYHRGFLHLCASCFLFLSISGICIQMHEYFETEV